ncbi:disease resistance protein RGA5-like [Triticum aestivum]|uniref:disease resistance protein RGA5-like n=1 Tax=Triticum aestivum TaxID=4565 RepID=UPI001D002FC3|nr:disease resistance protein RGA5-like [Triticum aestivum]
MVHLNIIRALSPMKQPATNLCLDLERLLMFFIVIDDIWDSKVWNIIKCALLDNNHGSRVITTTRILNVATETGDIYKLKPLSQHLSEELLYTRLFGGKDKCPFDQPAEVSRIFLQKCGGVPLAIITIASLLAGKPMKNWSKVFKSIGFGSGDNNTDVENTRKILSFSYYDLPCYLRPCLLHLSIYPEDYLIMKDKLIWQWVAEGFVNEEPGEQNFVAILDSNEEHTPSQCNARRLAVQKRVVPLANMSMPKLRSCDPSAMPSLSNFQVLRVLAMEKCSFERDRPYHLEHLGRLSQLRYLSLESACIRKLPEEIGDLKFLQTLDLRDTYIKELPQSIGLLRKLKCLRADTDGVGITVPNWIGNLTSLEVRALKDASADFDFIGSLENLPSLQRVHASIRRDNAYVCDIDKVIDDDKEDEEKLDSEQKEQEPHSHDDDNHPGPHLTESNVDAAGTSPPVPERRRTWRRWACFACLDSGSSSSAAAPATAGSDQCGASGHGIDQAAKDDSEAAQP